MSSYAHERLKRAKAQLESAKRNFAEGDVETASNRAFLAAENAAAAIVKAGGHLPPVHSRVRSQFEDLCDRGIVSYRFRGILIESYRLRLRGDYGRRYYKGARTPELKREAVQHLIDQVTDLIVTVERTAGRRRSSYLE
jgi:uncharacterized protein (UPF0332 family)